MESTPTNKENRPKQPMTSWMLLGAILILVGGLLATWVIRYDNTLASDMSAGESANLPVSDFKTGLSYISSVWEEKAGQFLDLFGSDSEPQAEVGDEQNEGQVGQLTNAGLTNEQIETIEQDLFENVAPQE